MKIVNAGIKLDVRSLLLKLIRKFIVKKVQTPQRLYFIYFQKIFSFLHSTPPQSTPSSASPVKENLSHASSYLKTVSDLDLHNCWTLTPNHPVHPEAILRRWIIPRNLSSRKFAFPLMYALAALAYNAVCMCSVHKRRRLVITLYTDCWDSIR